MEGRIFIIKDNTTHKLRFLDKEEFLAWINITVRECDTRNYTFGYIDPECNGLEIEKMDIPTIEALIEVR